MLYSSITIIFVLELLCSTAIVARSFPATTTTTSTTTSTTRYSSSRSPSHHYGKEPTTAAAAAGFIKNFSNSSHNNLHNDYYFYRPEANPSAVVLFGPWRITILTQFIFRLELSNTTTSATTTPAGTAATVQSSSNYYTFDDRATFAVVNRYFETVPHFTISTLNSTAIAITVAPSSFDSTQQQQPPASTTTTSSTPTIITVVDTPNLREAISVSFEAPSSASTVPTATTTTWRIGDPNPGNLGGTYLQGSLDCYQTPESCHTCTASFSNGCSALGEGLLSTDGWFALDDGFPQSRFVNGSESGWLDVGHPTTDLLDIYLLVAPLLTSTQTPSTTISNNTDTDRQKQQEQYGNTRKNKVLSSVLRVINYTAWLGQITTVLGSISIPPRSALGVWWSREYTYSESEFIQEVLVGYANHSLPLDQVSLDEGWHTMPQNNWECPSSSGYTWNTELFPNPSNFTSFLHNNTNPLGHSIKLLLNLHPQYGVNRCQQQYQAFATAIGFSDWGTNATIVCSLQKQEWAKNFFEIIIDPLGADYMWTDMCCDGFLCAGLTTPAPQLWSNIVYSQHLRNTLKRRPLVLSRFGGIGNHRYPVGFSGDAFQSWDTLQYEVETTPISSNLLFGWWSHDIGGFHNLPNSTGDGDPSNVAESELFLRWIQFGVFSPVYRTHCSFCERRIWLFSFATEMMNAVKLRGALVPYVYTMARLAFDSGVSLLRPMYYDDPVSFSLFPSLFNQTRRQYLFGPNMVVAPITIPVEGNRSENNPKNNSVKRWSVWLPSSSSSSSSSLQHSYWVPWSGGFFSSRSTLIPPGTWYTINTCSYGCIPVFVRAGTMIPLSLKANHSAALLPESVVWNVFVGNATEGKGSMYEDDGETNQYFEEDDRKQRKYDKSESDDSSAAAAAFVWTHAQFNVTQLPSVRQRQQGLNEEKEQSILINESLKVTFVIRTEASWIPTFMPTKRAHLIYLRMGQDGMRVPTTVNVNGAPIPEKKQQLPNTKKLLKNQNESEEDGGYWYLQEKDNEDEPTLPSPLLLPAGTLVIHPGYQQLNNTAPLVMTVIF